MSVNPVLDDHHGQCDGQYDGTLHEMRNGKIGEEGVSAVTVQFVVGDVEQEQHIGQDAEDSQHSVLDNEYRIDVDERWFNDGDTVILDGDVRESSDILDNNVHPVIRNIAKWLLVVGRRHLGWRFVE